MVKTFFNLGLFDMTRLHNVMQLPLLVTWVLTTFAFDQLEFRIMVLIFSALVGVIVGCWSNLEFIKNSTQGKPITILAVLMTLTFCFALPEILSLWSEKVELNYRLSSLVTTFAASISFSMAKYWIVNQDTHGKKVTQGILGRIFPQKNTKSGGANDDHGNNS